MKFINPIFMSNSRRISLALVLLFSCAAQIIAVPFVVTTTVDNGNDGSPTPGSLRAGINAVNAATNDAINFNIPNSDPGWDPSNNTWTIQPPVDLPNIVNTVTIDGYTQPGSSVNSLAQGDNAVLTIVLNGSNYTVGDGMSTGNGLHFAAGSDNSIVRGLVINQWIDNGILIDTSDANITGITIIGNFIGTDASGTAQMANRAGIGNSGAVNTPFNTTIGTSDVADRNIIAGSFGFRTQDNYVIRAACISSLAAINTSIKNNYIGTDKTGTNALENSQLGISLWADEGSILGGATSAEQNIISGHLIFGVRLRQCSQVLVQGNFIGTDITGTKALGNGNSGIEFDDSITAIGFTVGSTVLGNLISGNRNGIRLGDNLVSGAILNTIQNNLIGTDFTGNNPLPNTRFGLVLDDQQNTITGNTISGNLGGGALIYSIIATQNTLVNNFMGTDRTGTKPLGNKGNGLQIGLYSAAAGPSNNTIGG